MIDASLNSIGMRRGPRLESQITSGRHTVCRSLTVTIELNPPFHRLFDAVSQGDFWPSLQRAVAAEGSWGSTCCPGASDTSGPLDVVAACKPPLVQQCALWQRENWPLPSN